MKLAAIMDELNTQIVDAIRCDPELTKLQLCRWLNGMIVQDCKYCDCYANPRKRKLGLAFKPSCDVTFATIRTRIKKLGIKSTKQKITDHYQPRGWDWGWVLKIEEADYR